MKTVTIEIRKKSAEDFLKVMEKQNSIRILKVSPKQKLKRRVKEDLEEGFRLMKLEEEGKVKLKSARALLDEL
ncbi:MAG: hypothetical protein KIS94_14460 [Chitinophagales bacterium]|nr:hypothetical protein [Chitinophagales bacterium]